jgi:hypothetical protein
MLHHHQLLQKHQYTLFKLQLHGAQVLLVLCTVLGLT